MGRTEEVMSLKRDLRGARRGKGGRALLVVGPS